eukprot:7975127-Prorocentrum_lima.AAC.1
MRSPWAPYWREAVARELTGLTRLNAWTVVKRRDIPPTANVMRCHFVFAVKIARDNTVERFKARLVADGNTQRHGVDFNHIFSTVVKVATIRLVLIISAARGYYLSSIDIRQAYVQANLTEELYMAPPPGQARVDADGDDVVYRLHRSIYGLKQAGREWNRLLVSFLLSWGLKQSDIDVCLFTYSRSGAVMWILVYVDDLIIACSDPALRAKFVRDLGARFPLDDK